LNDAVAAFGKATAAKLSNAGISGAPEDQLPGPLEGLIADLALLTGLPPGAVGLVGETSLVEDRTRSDYAISLSGPAVSFSGPVRDFHHYKGSFGGRVSPLWADERAAVSNIKATVLSHLAETYYGHDVAPSNLISYLAAVMGHPAFTRHFADDLKQPGLRVPITKKDSVDGAA
jgi:hypothetical protein